MGATSAGKICSAAMAARGLLLAAVCVPALQNAALRKAEICGVNMHCFLIKKQAEKKKKKKKEKKKKEKEKKGKKEKEEEKERRPGSC